MYPLQIILIGASTKAIQTGNLTHIQTNLHIELDLDIVHPATVIQITP
jgi:hypothetical protein